MVFFSVVVVICFFSFITYGFVDFVGYLFSLVDEHRLVGKKLEDFILFLVFILIFVCLNM